jgi:hypothetical protein
LGKFPAFATFLAEVGLITYEGIAGYVFELLSGKWFREVFRLWSADIL